MILRRAERQTEDVAHKKKLAMFNPDTTKTQLREVIDEMSDLDFARFLYCQKMAGAYLAVAKFEDMLVSAMHMCDRIKLEKALGPDADRWESSLAKRALLEQSTLGSLIKILEQHKSVSGDDIHYLKWIKNKRDYFVHRLFHDGAWPGDLDAESCRFMTRRLHAIQIWLSRAERNIWLIFERAGFVELDRLNDGGLLAMNLGILEVLDVHNGASGDKFA